MSQHLMPFSIAFLVPSCVIIAVALLACSASQARQADDVAGNDAPVDSIVLERTRCFGTCPAYRVRVSRNGQVLFLSRNWREQGVATTDTVARSTADSLLAFASRTGFFSLPDSIDRGSPLCADWATDHATITIGLFGRMPKRVVYYTGCYLRSDHTIAPQLAELRRFVARIDSLTGARRRFRERPR